MPINLSVEYPLLEAKVQRLETENKDLKETLNDTIEFIESEFKEVKKYLKNDVGQLDMKTDPMQSLSFNRGKQAAYCMAYDRLKKAKTAIQNNTL